MAKRKTVASSEDESASESEVEQPKPASKKSKKAPKEDPKPRTIKKPKFSDLEGESEGAPAEPASKSTKAAAAATKKAAAKSGGTAQAVDHVDLGKKKRVSINVFKGTPLVDIREYYGEEDDLKPGKKGISLTVEQWDKLKESVDMVDELVHAVAS